jgi:hypothetical protein
MSKLEKMLVEAGVREEAVAELAKGIQGTLTVYAKTNVWYENGRYDQTPHSMLTATYAADRKYITTIKDTDIYTEQERQQHLVEASKANWLD